MSLDPPYIPEFAQAGFLAPVPDDVAERVTEDVVQSAIDGLDVGRQARRRPVLGQHAAAVVQEVGRRSRRAGHGEAGHLGPADQAAQDQDTRSRAQGIRAEALTVWLNALIESAGGHIIEKTADNPEDIELGLDTEAGRAAAEVMHDLATSGAVGPAFSTAGEDSSVTDFEEGDASFMVNWPFVWGRALAAVEAGTLDQSVPDDYGWTIYPRSSRTSPPRRRTAGSTSASVPSARTSTAPTRPRSASSPRRTRPTTSPPTATRRR